MNRKAEKLLRWLIMTLAIALIGTIAIFMFAFGMDWLLAKFNEVLGSMSTPVCLGMFFLFFGGLVSWIMVDWNDNG